MPKLPLWAWAGLAIAVLWMLSRRRSAAAAATQPTVGVGTGPLTGGMVMVSPPQRAPAGGIDISQWVANPISWASPAGLSDQPLGWNPPLATSPPAPAPAPTPPPASSAPPSTAYLAAPPAGTISDVVGMIAGGGDVGDVGPAPAPPPRPSGGNVIYSGVATNLVRGLGAPRGAGWM